MAESEHPHADVILNLALGHLTGPERDVVISHLADCPECRRELETLTASVESTLAAVPRTEPRPAFTAAVVERLEVLGGADSAAGVGASRPEPVTGASAAQLPTRRRVPGWASVAAAAVLGIAAGSGLTLALGNDGGVPDTEQPVATVASGVALTTADGTQVGTVSRSWSQGEPVLVVDIVGGEAGRNYLCRLALADGGTRDVGAWTLSPDRPNSWVVPDPGVTGVELVTETGVIWSSATL